MNDNEYLKECREEIKRSADLMTTGLILYFDESGELNLKTFYSPEHETESRNIKTVYSTLVSTISNFEGPPNLEINMEY